MPICLAEVTADKPKTSFNAMPELPYKRIISLVPSLTELLFDLSLEDQLIGRTRFCIHPEEKVDNVEIIGGTKNPRLEKIVEMNPDFILANKEENRKEDIEVLKAYANVMVTDISTIEDALLEISSIGLVLGVREEARQIIQQATQLLSEKPSETPISTAYLIWKDPWMTIGADTYIHDVLKTYGLQNVFIDQERYPKITLDKLSAKRPELILLSSEPYPFKEKHLEEIQKACPYSRVKLVNGEWFSWYGSRMLSSFEALNEWRKAI